MKIGVIALGLIGGSILKRLSQYNHELIAVTRNKKSLEDAKKYCSVTSENISNLKDCELVFVCTPISKTVQMLDKLEKIVDKNCIVCDVASVKTFIMKKKRPYKFIGSHPMAGTENSGFEASFDTLFEQAKWVLTPQKNIEQTDIEKLSEIISQTGAEIIITTPEKHDEAVALISHLPMLISQTLFKITQKNDLALKLASSGFRDTTRLAMSNPQMAEDMLNYNNKNIYKYLSKIENEALNLSKTNYKKKLDTIITNRKKMYSKEGKNIL